MEDCLAALRQEVDRLDDQIAELFLKRMEVTGRIGACKEGAGGAPERSGGDVG